MRVAFFSPLPPCRSGIADYSETLVAHLKPLADVEVFADAGQAFDPSRFDIALYHLGNNPHHGFVYEAALRHPGVVTMHESNLHHLIADLTIRRDDWDAYLRECEYEGGPEALAYARRVRALEVGPDYEGVQMTRRILESARAVVVHSRFMVDEMHATGFAGPIARIPHGAWIPEADRNAWRYRLGIDEPTPLVGIFGFLKPYKRIAESLRAFRRLLRVVPAAKMILVGEPHSDFPLQSLIQTLGLSAAVRVLGFTPIGDFTGYMAACDIVLNLRYPTVGESSGSLLRALGLGKAVLVSGVGAFGEFPDDVCLKVPVDAGEEDLIFEYLNLLASRPDVARALGERAACYVKEECNWDRVAGLYASFLQSVVDGAEWDNRTEDRTHASEVGRQKTGPIEPAYVTSWAADAESLGYLDTHLTRLVKTLEITPPGGPEDRILEMGAYLQITPALRSKLGYGAVRGCYYGPAGKIDYRSAKSAEGETFDCEIDLFNAEKDPFPYPDEHFSTVLCCELIEHLTEDPMHLMSEINRIVQPGGHLVLTTPNIGSLRGIAAILEGYHPGIFTAYIRPRAEGEVEARHNREYTPKEIQRLLQNSGFTVTLLETGPFRQTPRPEEGWVLNLLERFELPRDLRGDDIYVVGRKTGAVRERFPGLVVFMKAGQAGYEDTDVRLSGEPAGLEVEARFNLRNRSGDSWRPEEGFAAGFHIYDSETGTLVVDGARQTPPGDIAPGASVFVDLRFALPPESGHYDVYISPMREDVCWFYTMGWPFLRVEAIVDDGRARLERVAVVTLSAIRRENLVRAVGRAFTLPVSTIARNRSLIRTMVRRDILGRYRGSFGGVFWTILNPLLLMLTYFFVFGVVLRTRFGSDPSRAGFALYFLAGMLPWLAFSEAAGRAPSVMLEHRNFVKKLVFAVETLPVNLVVSGLVSEVFALLLFTIGLFLARGALPASVVWLPALIVPQVLFTAGVCWFLGALGVFVRDLGQVIGFLLTLWFFLTPICYPEASLPAAALPLLAKNPMFVLVRGYRAIFLEGQAPLWGSLWKLWVASAAVFILGHAWFYKLRRSFADII